MLAFLALAAALQQPSDVPAFAPADEETVVITPDNVELNGAGVLEFRPDARDFAVAPPANEDGAALTVRLWLDAAGRPTACDIGQSLLRQAAETACGQLMRSASFRLFEGMNAPLRRGFLDVLFRFKGQAGREVTAAAFPGYRNVALIYPADTVADADRLKPMDGRIAMTVTPDDYPWIAMRYEMESASVAQLAIGRDGAIRTCRPLSALKRRTALLDNHLCALYLQRGRYIFSPGAPDYDGVRYLTVRLYWKLPT